LARTFLAKTNAEWTRWAAEHDLPIAPVDVWRARSPA
jgi:hypothetical protein